MTKIGLHIQTMLTKRIYFQTDSVFLLRQVTEKGEKVHPSRLLKFLLASLHCTHLVMPETQTDPSQNRKSAIFVNPLSTL